jgi:hypothetical protein
MERMPRALVVLVSVLAGAAVGLTATAAGAPAPALRSSIPPAAPGVVVQSEFVAIDPCRVVDTRAAAAGPMRNRIVRAFEVAGTAGFPTQGGKTGGCGIPAGASAVTASITATAVQSTGFLRVWAEDAPEPSATVLNYARLGGGMSVGATVPIGQGTDTGILAKAYGGTTHLVVDVFGYFREPIAARVSSTGELQARSGHVTGASRLGTGFYRVTFERPVQGCVAAASSTSSSLVNAAAFVGSTSVDVQTTDVGSSPPAGRDSGFALTVTC